MQYYYVFTEKIMNTGIWCLVTLTLGIAGMPVRAAVPIPQDTIHKIDLNTALSITRSHYPAIKAKAALTEAAKSDVSVARMEYLPQLIVQDQYLYASTNNVQGAAYSNGGTTLSVTGGTRDHNVYQGVWTSYATMLIDWKFFNFGKVKANVQVAEQAQQKSRLEYENEIFRQQVKVADAYLLLIAMQQFVGVQQQNLERAEMFRSAIQANTLSGLRPGVDSSLANAEVAKARLMLQQAVQEAKVQELRLSENMGLPQQALEIDTAGLTNTLPALGAAPDAVDSLHAPFIRYYKSMIDLQESKASATKRTVYPSLSFLSAGWARGSGIDNITGHLNSALWEGIQPRALNYMVGVAFRWNILSVPLVKRQYNSELQRVAYAKELYNEATLKTNTQLATAKLQLTTALQQLEQAPLQYDAALQAYKQSQARYRSGLSTMPELYQALYTLNRATADQLTAYNNVWRAVLLQSAAAGDLSLFTKLLRN